LCSSLHPAEEGETVDDRRELEKGSAAQEGNTTEKHSFDELAKGVADGTISRGRALRPVGAAVLGGVLSIFALSQGAEAARRRKPPLKILWAVVTINADQSITVTRSKGVVASSRLGMGVYKIGFKRDVSGCACVASPDQTQLGFVSPQVNSFVATERDVVVSTYNSDGDAADLPFQVVGTARL
jgi:hypothetical protein